MAKNRSDRDAWHLFNKLTPIIALMSVIGMGYLVCIEVLNPMIENMMAGILPQK